MKDKNNSGRNKCRNHSILSMFQNQHKKNKEKAELVKGSDDESDSDDVKIVAIENAEECSKYFNNKSGNTPVNIEKDSRKSRRLSLKRKSKDLNNKDTIVQKDLSETKAKKSKSSPDLKVLKIEKDKDIDTVEPSLSLEKRSDSENCHNYNNSNKEVSLEVIHNVDLEQTSDKRLSEDEICERERKKNGSSIKHDETKIKNDKLSKESNQDNSQIIPSYEIESGNTNREITEEQISQESNQSETGNSKDDGNKEEDVDTDVTKEYRIPYYLENFELILSSVTGDEFYLHLFNEEDTDQINKFNNLSGFIYICILTCVKPLNQCIKKTLYLLLNLFYLSCE